MPGQSVPVVPSYVGFLETTWDALVLVEAALRGHCPHISRRPHDRERAELIRSGHIFIYEESASGIKRWTDGVTWSPSRILNNFLVYREMTHPFPPGEKKKALKKSNGSGSPEQSPIQDTSNLTPQEVAYNNQLRELVGSLIDSYDFKEKGRIKKTITLSIHGVVHHVISYYTIEDVIAGRLCRPVHDHQLRFMFPRKELMVTQAFRQQLDQNPVLFRPEPEQGYMTEHNGFGGAPTQMAPNLSHFTNMGVAPPMPANLYAYQPHSQVSSVPAGASYANPQLPPVGYHQHHPEQQQPHAYHTVEAVNNVHLQPHTESFMQNEHPEYQQREGSAEYENADEDSPVYDIEPAPQHSLASSFGHQQYGQLAGDLSGATRGGVYSDMEPATHYAFDTGTFQPGSEDDYNSHTLGN